MNREEAFRTKGSNRSKRVVKDDRPKGYSLPYIGRGNRLRQKEVAKNYEEF